MNSLRHLSLGLIVCVLALSCGKKKTQYGNVSASLMRSETVTASLTSGSDQTLVAASGSMVQSFTPTSVKLPIFAVNVCSGTSSCKTVYKCAANTVADCGVELSKIDAFANAINSGSAELEDGETFDYIGVQFCPEGDSSGIQNITLSGTVTIQGTTYATDPTAGLVAGTTAKDTSISINGGCASFFKMANSFTVAKDETTSVKLFFDPSYYAYGGVSGGSVGTDEYSSSYCVGSTSAFVCGQVITVVATIDSGTPTAEHYMVANVDTAQGSTDTSSPTAKVALYFGSDGKPIGGVQTSYRLSGSSVSWGWRMDGGLSLFPKTVDSTTVSFGEPEGSVSLANWYKNFKRSSHTGTYTFSKSGVATDSTYKATKL